LVVGHITSYGYYVNIRGCSGNADVRASFFSNDYTRLGSVRNYKVREVDKEKGVDG